MQTRALGNTGIFVPRLGLALGSLCRTGLGAQPDDEVVEFLRRSLDLQVGFFAAGLHCGEGRALRLLGQALQGQVGGQVALRLGRGAEDDPRFSLDALKADFEQALKALGRSRVDLLVLQRPGLAQAETLAQALQGWVSAGLVGAWGVHVDKVDAGQTWLQAPGLGFLEIPFNALEPGLAGLLPLAAEAGKGIVSTSPLAGGWLAGSRRTGFFNLPIPGMSAEAAEARAARVKALSLRGAPGSTQAQAALQWVLGHPQVSVALSGARSRGQWEDMITAAD